MPILAFDGGSPVRTRPFPSWPVYGYQEEQLLLEVLHSGNWGILTGDKVHLFEEKFAEYTQARYALCVPNGTLALELALLALGIGKGDEVILPAYTFIATASAVLRVGATPVFADLDVNSLTLDPLAARNVLTERTKALLPVHLGGRPADLDAFRSIAQEHQLFLLEDACQAWGAEWQGRRVGAIGNLGAFSFQSSKNLTAGEGGALVTNDENLFQRCWSIHNVGRIRNGAWYQHELLGLNLRMTEWQGAILLAQLGRMDGFAQRREWNSEYLTRALAEIPGVTPLPVDPRVTRNAWHLFLLRYKSASFGGRGLDDFVKALAAEGIQPLSRGYIPLHQSPAIRNEMNSRFGVDPSRLPLPQTEKAASEVFWLAQNVLLGTQEDMDDIVRAIHKIQTVWSSHDVG